MNLKKIYIIVLLIFIIPFGFYFLLPRYEKQGIIDLNIKEISGLQIFTPKKDEAISSPLKIEGLVNGDGWIGFEGQVGTVKLFDSNNNELALGILTAVGEWMSRLETNRGSSAESGQVKINFETELKFNKPKSSEGYLIFYNENPSGDLLLNKTLTLPIKFK